jgi:hypothetical protein
MANQEEKNGVSQFYVINKGIRNEAHVSNNEYMLLMNIDNLQNNLAVEWYEALPRMTQNEFLASLARLVHTNKFSYKGVEEMLKRLAEIGYLNVEALKVQVTERWRDIVTANRGYLQNDETNQQLLDKLGDLLADIEIPKTQNFSQYKATVRKFVYDAKKALKRKILSPEWQALLEKMEGVIKSDFLLKKFFDERLANSGNPKATPKDPTYSDENVQKQINDRTTWHLHVGMSQADFLQELKNLVFWCELGKKRGFVLTDDQEKRYNWAKDVEAKPEIAAKFYNSRISTLKAEQAEADANKVTTIAPSVLDAAAVVASKKM